MKAVSTISVPRISYSPRFKAGAKKKGKDPMARLFFVACFIFLTGIALGALVVSFDDVTLLKYLSNVINAGLESRVTGKLFVTFINCLIPHLIFMLLCLILANCTFGAPLIICLIIFKGIGAGLMGGFIYRYTGLRGILYNLFVTMPPTLISAIGFLWLCVWAVKHSITLYAVAVRGISRSTGDTSAELYHYLAVCGILSSLSAVAESLLFKYLGVFFIPLK